MCCFYSGGVFQFQAIEIISLHTTRVAFLSYDSKILFYGYWNVIQMDVQVSKGTKLTRLTLEECIRLKTNPGSSDHCFWK